MAIQKNLFEREKDFMKVFKTEKYLSKIRGFCFANDLIKVITEIRRSGKSTLM